MNANAFAFFSSSTFPLINVAGSTCSHQPSPVRLFKELKILFVERVVYSVSHLDVLDSLLENVADNAIRIRCQETEAS
ncbi:hypothetical protein TYRP_000776 [Tyrophagus putrescentiae]|nr:hypothetical protein TYRP_000776 [Tyrophagus putrescentiae]